VIGIRAALPLAVLTALVVTACSGGLVVSSKAPPLIVCDTTLSSSAAGAVMDDATGAEAEVSAETEGDVVILQLSPGCQHGADYSIEPTAAASVTKVAAAQDYKAAAVVLSPKTASFDVHVIHRDGSPGLVQIRLDGNFVPQPKAS
jgi:hypothetical protein